MICDASMGNVTLEGRDVTFERGGEIPILLDHTLGEKPRNGISDNVLMLECHLESCKELSPSS